MTTPRLHIVELSNIANAFISFQTQRNNFNKIKGPFHLVGVHSVTWWWAINQFHYLPNSPTVILPFFETMLLDVQTIQFHPTAGLFCWIHAAAVARPAVESQHNVAGNTVTFNRIRIWRSDQHYNGEGLVVKAKHKKHATSYSPVFRM